MFCYWYSFPHTTPRRERRWRRDRSQKVGTHPPDRLRPATRDPTTVLRHIARKRPQGRFQSPRDLTSSTAIEPSFFRNEGFAKKGPRATDHGRCFRDCAGLTQPLAARPVSEGRAPRDRPLRCPWEKVCAPRRPRGGKTSAGISGSDALQIFYTRHS